jgi:hypothetical protein
MPSIAQTAPVQTVRIKSAWSGLSLSPPPRVEVLIQSRGNNHFECNGTPVNASLIESLAQALGAPAVAHVESSNLGITQKWLDDSVEAASGKNIPLSRYSSAFYWPTFKAGFMDRSVIEAVLPSLFSGFHTDDYPEANVEVVFANGDAWSAASSSQYEFMIPWQVKVRGTASTTWNANLSKAVAALLPDRAVNRSRLEGESFSYRLGNAMMEHIVAQWTEPALTVLRRRYSTDRERIDNDWSIDYGNPKDRQPEEYNLRVRLGGERLPEWLHIAAVLPVHDAVVDGAEDVLRLAPGYEKLVLSIAWLSGWAEKHRDTVEIRFANGRSFSDKAMAVFDADMKAMGEERLADEVRAVKEQVALIDVEGSGYWLVLPDKRMVLWRFDSRQSPSRPNFHPGLLKWSEADLPVHECAKYPSFVRHCAGVAVSPDGDLVSR